MNSTDSVEERLAQCSEDLAAAAMDLLRKAMRADDDESRAALIAREKRITRARRSVEKAITLLQGAKDADEF